MKPNKVAKSEKPAETKATTKMPRLRLKPEAESEQLQITWPEGQKPYKLERAGKPTRYQLLTDSLMRCRNAHRKFSHYEGLWVECPTADPAVVEAAPPNKTWDAWREGLRKGQQRDNEWFNAVRAKKQETTMSKDKDKSEKSEKKEKPAKTERANWNGHVATALIRWCGKKGFTPKQTRAIIEHADLEAAPATVHIQLGKGRKDENVPKLKGSQADELKAIAAKVKADKDDDEEKPTKKKSKKDKGEKSSKKEKAEADAETESSDDSEDEEPAVDDDE